MSQASSHTVVVGGSKGMGYAIARWFADQNHTVSVLSRGTPLPADTPASVTPFCADIGDREQCGSALSDLLKHSGPVANLILCQRYRGDEDEWQGEMQTSIEASRCIIETLAPHMQSDTTASIVLLTSAAAYQVAHDQPLGYHVGKAAINQMTRYYGARLGSNSIRVNAVAPGTVKKAGAEQYYETETGLDAQFKKVTPLGRMGKTEDIVSAVHFLCSRDAQFITGQVLTVDGGLGLHMSSSVMDMVRPAPDND